MDMSNFYKVLLKCMSKAVREELIYQLKGAINIELGNYIYDNNWMDWINKNDSKKPRLNIYCMNTGDGINIYIVDNRYSEIKKDELVFNCKDEIKIELEDKLMIGHYHSDDLLWLILNFEKEIRRMKNKINSYVEKNF